MNEIVLYAENMSERLYTPNQEFYVKDAEVHYADDIRGMISELADHCGTPARSFGITSEMIAEDIQNDGLDRYKLAIETQSDDAVGVVHYGITPRSWNGSRGAYIEDLIVRGLYRHGRGLGSLLVASVALEAMQYADSPEQAFVRLDTSMTDNDATLGYYRSQGFDGHNINFRLSGVLLEGFVDRHLP